MLLLLHLSLLLTSLCLVSAFGTVYLGLNLDTGELMAVKQINAQDISQKELVRCRPAPTRQRLLTRCACVRAHRRHWSTRLPSCAA